MTHEQETLKDSDSLLGALLSVGSAWARHGLNVGRSALETGAHTLQTTAAALGQLAEAIDEKMGIADDDQNAQADVREGEKPLGSG